MIYERLVQISGQCLAYHYTHTYTLNHSLIALSSADVPTLITFLITLCIFFSLAISGKNDKDATYYATTKPAKTYNDIIYEYEYNTRPFDESLAIASLVVQMWYIQHDAVVVVYREEKPSCSNKTFIHRYMCIVHGNITNRKIFRAKNNAMLYYTRVNCL